ncbi:MAG TPA: DUF3536 domain-containing protein [Pyrinomonadaceae bacterium]|nr:DUF3536 domain-containing protein [Pyrinomonadaceae bacterium]
MSALIIHGHFYQPPRENPWTGVIDPEPTAAPYSNWNERIHSECYEPNSAVPVVSPTGDKKIVNNYSNISFDFGPTLLSWLEKNHRDTYARVLAADAESVTNHQGHGNAIAHGYNHAILPLCNQRDRQTQVRWGLADFRHRFRREPASLWLPETACNNDVLDLLIDEELQFVILAPQQAKRVRTKSGEWLSVSADSLDTSSPYNYFHRDGSKRALAVFFYDPVLATEIAFGDALKSSAAFAEKLARRAAASAGLLNVATDGESYGHHHKFGDLCLAYALEVDAPARGFTITNYAEYLAAHPPQMEVAVSEGLLGEGSSWSCIHGVGRWIRDCGCQTDGKPGWNQKWRGPLRQALDYLRDEAAARFETTRHDLFIDPWKARDDAIQLILNERLSREQFLFAHAPRELALAERGRALLFLELQRNTLLMYTSCGWFFNDIAGIEPVQILKYAARAIDLMDKLGLPSPRERFLESLANAQSNRSECGTGADIFRSLVEPVNHLRHKDESWFNSEMF